MEIISGELVNESAIQALRDLEERNIIRLIVPTPKSKQRRFISGSISVATGNKWHKELIKMRREWSDRNI